MEFTKYPESVTAPVGDEVKFECAVRVPGERLTWRWRPDNDQWTDWRTVDGSTDKDTVSTRLVVQIKENTSSALYQVRYTNSEPYLILKKVFNFV